MNEENEQDRNAAIEELITRTALQHKPTRQLIWKILDMCSLNVADFSSDPAWTNYIVGRQSLGRDILVLLERADPRIYPNLILENMEESDG